MMRLRAAIDGVRRGRAPEARRGCSLHDLSIFDITTVIVASSQYTEVVIIDLAECM